ncbi:MAG: SEC-C metal-binding domain-containing protein, partial [Thermodesulfobacteriota bacterium]
GTDIVLGEGVRELGGLHILGTERHESRRIDNQLRGRSGRQGDPGSSRFYLALDDELLRLFGSDRISGLMDKMGVEEGQAIENKMISRAIENAQGRVEEHNFDIRKQLLEFDDVMNQQREVIYTRRREVMMAEDLEVYINDFIDDLLEEMYSPFESKGKDQPDEETRDILRSKLEEVFALDRVMDIKNYLPSKEETRDGIYSILEYLKESAGDQYQEVLRYFLLESLDRYWKEHLLNMDYMKEGIGLRGYGQKDPRREYKKEGFELFQELLYLIKESTIKNLCHIRIKDVSEEQLQHEDPTEDLQFSGSGGGEAKSQEPYKRDKPKVGRNEACPCGSGKKYKKCCGAS